LVALADAAGLLDLVTAHVAVLTDNGANADLKTMSLVAGMCAGADSIQDTSILRHGAVGKAFTHCYAPSTLESFLRSFTFGHVRQLDAAASRFLAALAALAERTPLLAGIDDLALVDLDGTVVEVHGQGKQGASFGYSGVRGLNAAAATVTAPGGAPVIVTTRLRQGSANSTKGSERIVADALGTVRRLRSPCAVGMLVLRADSAYYGRPTVHAAVKAGAKVSITVRQSTLVQRAIESIPGDAWTPIEYPDAKRDEDTGVWVSRDEVAEIPFTNFTSASASERVPGRLVVRRIRDLSTPADPEQESLFEVWRLHAFFTTVPADVMDTVAADKTHGGHEIIEQVFDASWAPPSPTCPPGSSTPTPGGSSSPSSRSTSPEPPGASQAAAIPGQRPPRSAGASSTSLQGSRPPRGASPSICRPRGRGRNPGRRSSTRRSDHQQSQPPDPPPNPRPDATPRGTPGRTVIRSRTTPPTATEPGTTIRVATLHPSVDSG
jgi:hypothetical protein